MLFYYVLENKTANGGLVILSFSAGIKKNSLQLRYMVYNTSSLVSINALPFKRIGCQPVSDG